MTEPEVKVLMLKGEKGDKGDTGTVDNTGLINAPAFQSLQAQVNNSANAVEKTKVLRPVIAFNAYWSNYDTTTAGGIYTTSIDSIKNEIDNMKDLVDSVVLLFRLYINGTVISRVEDLNIFKEAVSYIQASGLTVEAFKFHCVDTTSSIQAMGIQNFFDAYKNIVEETAKELDPQKGTELIVLNERGDLYNSSSTYFTYSRKLINGLIADGYKTSISFQSFQDVLSTDSSIVNVLNEIYVNSYNRISDKKESTSINEIETGIKDSSLDIINYIRNLYPRKNISFSEFGIVSNWAALEEPWSWNFDKSTQDTSGELEYRYHKALMNAPLGLNKVFLWFYSDIYKYDKPARLFAAYKRSAAK